MKKVENTQECCPAVFKINLFPIHIFCRYNMDNFNIENLTFALFWFIIHCSGLALMLVGLSVDLFGAD